MVSGATIQADDSNFTACYSNGLLVTVSVATKGPEGSNPLVPPHPCNIFARLKDMEQSRHSSLDKCSELF